MTNFSPINLSSSPFNFPEQHFAQSEGASLTSSNCPGSYNLTTEPSTSSPFTTSALNTTSHLSTSSSSSITSSSSLSNFLTVSSSFPGLQSLSLPPSAIAHNLDKRIIIGDSNKNGSSDSNLNSTSILAYNSDPEKDISTSSTPTINYNSKKRKRSQSSMCPFTSNLQPSQTPSVNTSTLSNLTAVSAPILGNREKINPLVKNRFNYNGGPADLNPNGDLNERVSLYDKINKKRISGFAAPKRKNLKTYMEKHPDVMIYIPLKDKKQFSSHSIIGTQIDNSVIDKSETPVIKKQKLDKESNKNDTTDYINYPSISTSLSQSTLGPDLLTQRISSASQSFHDSPSYLSSSINSLNSSTTQNHNSPSSSRSSPDNNSFATGCSSYRTINMNLNLSSTPEHQSSITSSSSTLNSFTNQHNISFPEHNFSSLPLNTSSSLQNTTVSLYPENPPESSQNLQIPNIQMLIDNLYKETIETQMSQTQMWKNRCIQLEINNKSLKDSNTAGLKTIEDQSLQIQNLKNKFTEQKGIIEKQNKHLEELNKFALINFEFYKNILQNNIHLQTENNKYKELFKSIMSQSINVLNLQNK